MAGAEALGSPLGDVECDQMLSHLALLERWNRAFNLSAVRDIDEMVSRHVLDSLCAAPYLAQGSLLDVGTGAGFPGLVLAIYQPTRPCVVLDSNGKKARFCRQVVGELGLQNVSVVATRAEHYEPTNPVGTLITRAFSNLEAIVGLATRLLTDGGRLVALRGPQAPAEVGALDLAERATVHPVSVPGLEAARFVVTIDYARRVAERVS
jgi:16S rRNA (guanine527-N7)-methyltransferase